MITLESAKRLIGPYAFVGAYAGCYALPQTAMDRRHVYLMHDILCAWPFASALELGSFNGASATAFVEAINKGRGLGAGGIATFCDVSVSESLIDVARNCRDLNRVRITPQPSWQVLDSKEPFDFIFVDASHDLDSVTLEVKRLLVRKPVCVMAHDTNATAAGYPLAEGAEFLKRTFEGLPGYQCLEDCEDREGEATQRGLFFATREPELYRVAQTVFQKWA